MVNPRHQEHGSGSPVEYCLKILQRITEIIRCLFLQSAFYLGCSYFHFQVFFKFQFKIPDNIICYTFVIFPVSGDIYVAILRPSKIDLNRQSKTQQTPTTHTLSRYTKAFLQNMTIAMELKIENFGRIYMQAVFNDTFSSISEFTKLKVYIDEFGFHCLR